MRSRGPQGTTVFTADSMAEQFGVNKDTYDAVELPRINAYVVCMLILCHISSED